MAFTKALLFVSVRKLPRAWCGFATPMPASAVRGGCGTRSGTVTRRNASGVRSGGAHPIASAKRNRIAPHGLSQIGDKRIDHGPHQLLGICPVGTDDGAPFPNHGANSADPVRGCHGWWTRHSSGHQVRRPHWTGESGVIYVTCPPSASALRSATSSRAGVSGWHRL